jgi:hypothetical protein
VVPAPPPRATPSPGWRDVVPGGARPGEHAGRSPLSGASPERELLPGGGRPVAETGPPPGGARSAPEPPARGGAAQSTAAAEQAPRGTSPRSSLMGHPGGLYPPMAPGMAGGQERERRRPDYLLDDSDAFADDRWFPPPVITPDDEPPLRR